MAQFKETIFKLGLAHRFKDVESTLYCLSLVVI